MKTKWEDLLEPLSILAGKIDDEVANKLGDKSNSRRNKILDTGWSRIPNCEYMTIVAPEIDKELKKIGLEVNKLNKFRVTIHPYKNKGINRYMIYQCKRLKKHVNNGKLFWTITWYLLRRSNAFRVSAINHVMRGWEQKIPLHKVFAINRSVSAIFNEHKTNLDYTRAYIPKGDTWRPLGVPSLPWRVALHMFANFLQIFIQGKLILDSQHGFVPKKGVLTAWKEIIRKVLDADYIYECDLKQFFPSVQTEAAIKKWYKLGMPVDTCQWFRGVTNNAAKLTGEQKLDEDSTIRHQFLKSLADDDPRFKDKDPELQKVLDVLRYQHYFGGPADDGISIDKFYELYKIKAGIARKSDEEWVRKQEEERKKKEEEASKITSGLDWLEKLADQFSDPDDTGPTEREKEMVKYPPWRYYEWALDIKKKPEHKEPEEPVVQDLDFFISQFQKPYESYDETKLPRNPYDVKGFPQGAPTSPLASICILGDFLTQAPSVSYADDPIFYGNQEFKIRDNPADGIILHPEKSGWVKKAGQWIKPLKFLGLVYNPVTGSISAQSNPILSKNKSTLELSRTKMLEIIESGSERIMISREAQRKNSFEFTWKNKFRTTIFGLLVSRLQSGKFTMDKLEQDFQLTIGNHSWMEKQVRNSSLLEVRNNFNVFNSSSYACHSLFGLLRLWQRKYHFKTGNYFKPVMLDSVKVLHLSPSGRKRRSKSSD